jgi:hypothetical protein
MLTPRIVLTESLSNACAIKNGLQASGFRLQARKGAYGLNLLRFFFACTPAAAVFLQYKTVIGERKTGGPGQILPVGARSVRKKMPDARGDWDSGFWIRDSGSSEEVNECLSVEVSE